jgi:hypothetical protein
MAARDRTLIAIRRSLVPLLRLREDGVAGNIGATATTVIRLMRMTPTDSYTAQNCSSSEKGKSGPKTRHYCNEAMTVALMIMTAMAQMEMVIMSTTLRDIASAERSPATISDSSFWG